MNALTSYSPSNVSENGDQFKAKMAPFHVAVAFVLVVMMSLAVTSIRFALLPDVYALTWTTNGLRDTRAASSAQECVDLVVADDPSALVIHFYSTSGQCRYGTSIYSYYQRSGGEEPVFYLRTDNVTKSLTDADCFTNQDTEYLIAKLSFGDEQCVNSTFDAVSGLCVAKNFGRDFMYDPGRYRAGCLRDGTQYMLSRDKAMESVNYECADDEYAAKMVFGGTWYCYDNIGDYASASLIKDNTCEVVLGSGSGPVKVTEAREYGFLYAWWTRKRYTPYLGLYLQNGTTSYVWYDGSAATDLPWADGRPLDNPANDMVYVTANYTVADGDGTDNGEARESVACKTPAPYVGYDSTSKFT